MSEWYLHSHCFMCKRVSSYHEASCVSMSPAPIRFYVSACHISRGFMCQHATCCNEASCIDMSPDMMKFHVSACHQLS